jgi:hypothetical protein
MSADPSDPSIVSIVDDPTKTPFKHKPHRVGDGTPGPGRPQGSTNRTTQTMRFMMEQIVAGELANVQAALHGLLNGVPPTLDAVTGKIVSKGSPPDLRAYMAGWTSLVDFTMPRLTRVEVKDERVPVQAEVPEGATQEDAQAVYLRLVKS